MKLQIYHIRTFAFLCIIAIATISCKKNQVEPQLAPSAVYIKEAFSTDTAKTVKLSTDKDSLITIKLTAAVAQAASSGGHAIVFAVDTNQMSAYRAKYGNALVLPASSYFIPFASGSIAAGATESSAAEINILGESSLRQSTTYVLPVVIKSVDGQSPEKTGQGQVIYLLFKTGATDFGNPISKTSWSIVSFSSTYSAALYPAAYAIDNKPTTQWVSNLTGTMPQYVTIDMGQSYNLKVITFQEWASYAAGANPTQIMIELSTDGSNWTNAGTYNDASPGTVIKNLKLSKVTPARYIRFTVLKASVYASVYTPVAIAEIGANN
jgi:hypothetical protein